MSTTSSLKNVRSLLPGPFYNCLAPVSTNSGSLQPQQVVYSSCSILYGIQLLCGKYTEGFVVCQVILIVKTKSPDRSASSHPSFVSNVLYSKEKADALPFSLQHDVAYTDH